MELHIILVVALTALSSFTEGIVSGGRARINPNALKSLIGKRQTCNLWRLQNNAYSANGMVHHSNGVSEEQCKAACLAKPDCWTVDYIPATGFIIQLTPAQCWHGSVPNQGSSGYRVNGKHWIIEGDCRTNPCKPNPCANNAACSYSGSVYTCTCPAGYTGRTCSSFADNCTPNKCQNGGVCFSGFNSFSCNCRPGFAGDRCEQLVNYCSPNPCLNGGQCSLNVQGYQYMCTCRAGFGGNNCKDVINYCDPNPCQNGGKCSTGVQGYSYMCNCPPGFGGNNCKDSLNPRGLTYNCATNNPCSVKGYQQGKIYFKHDNPNYLIQCTDVGGCQNLRVDPPEVADDIVDEANSM